MSKIEWTGKTWNPISGCKRISPGCQNCYAETMTKRLAAMGQEKYQGLLNDQNRFNGVIKFDEKALLIPLKTKKPTTYFVNSMSDLFHENVKDEWIDKIFAVMALSPQHTFQILTKRADRMRDYFRSFYLPQAFFRGQQLSNWIEDKFGKDKVMPVINAGISQGLPNVWLGVSVENQKAADERIPLLLETPAAIRFLSCEPLLEEINLRPYMPFCLRHKIPENIMDCLGAAHDGTEWRKPDWVIFGGESGQEKIKVRSCMHEWIRDGVQQCQAARVPVFVKQLGTNSFYFDLIRIGEYEWKTKDKKGGDIAEFPEDLRLREMPR